jgi:DNA replication factor GINS
VYVTRDVGEIMGVDDRTYRLAAEDVVDLPAENAAALLARDAAEPLS